MKLAAVLGDPIEHSRSPALHGHWLARHGIDGTYVPLRVTPERLEAALRLLPEIGFAGCNVTIPHKEAALALAHEATDRARRVGAANTLVFEEGRIRADNTDGVGFLANLRQRSGWIADRPAVVLGAGGAARGIVAALVDAGVPEIRVANRTAARAKALAGAFPRCVAQGWPGALADAGLLVNTTSLGMAGQPALEVDLGPLPRNAAVADIVYAPLETDLLRRAAARGHPVVDGLGMLLHQAVPGFEAWFGERPEVDDALRAAVLG